MEQQTPRKSSFKRAERTQVKYKIGISGPSGSGKTLGAIALARQIAGPDGRVAVIDTENHSSSFYSDDYEFDIADLFPPYTPTRYLALLTEAIEDKFDVIVIDSTSHEWAGTGGLLEQKDEADKRPGSNSYTNWGNITKAHNEFVSAILQAPVHIICTMRSKQDYVLEEKNGKKVPRKLGMAPIQRDGFEYELGVVFDLQMDNRAKVSKKRIDVLDMEATYDLAKPQVGRILTDWLKSGKPLLSSPMNTGNVATDEPAEPEAPLTFDDAQLVPLPGPEGSWGGKAGNPLGTFSTPQLLKIRDYLRDSLEKNETAEKRRTAEACSIIIAQREREIAAKHKVDVPDEPAPSAPAATLDDHGESEHAYAKGVSAEEAEPEKKPRGRSKDHPDNNLPF